MKKVKTRPLLKTRDNHVVVRSWFAWLFSSRTSLSLKMTILSRFETSVYDYLLTERHIPEELNPQLHRCGSTGLWSADVTGGQSTPTELRSKVRHSQNTHNCTQRNTANTNSWWIVELSRKTRGRTIRTCNADYLPTALHIGHKLNSLWCMSRTFIQSVTGGMCETSGECSLGQTIPI